MALRSLFRLTAAFDATPSLMWWFPSHAIEARATLVRLLCSRRPLYIEVAWFDGRPRTRLAVPVRLYAQFTPAEPSRYRLIRGTLRGRSFGQVRLDLLLQIDRFAPDRT